VTYDEPGIYAGSGFFAEFILSNAEGLLMTTYAYSHSISPVLEHGRLGASSHLPLQFAGYSIHQSQFPYKEFINFPYIYYPSFINLKMKKT